MKERTLRSRNQTPTTNHLAGPHVHNPSEPLIPEILSEIQVRPTVPATPRPARAPPAALRSLGPHSPPPQNPTPLTRPRAATAGGKAPRTPGRDARQERPGAHHASHTHRHTGPPRHRHRHQPPVCWPKRGGAPTRRVARPSPYPARASPGRAGLSGPQTRAPGLHEPSLGRGRHLHQQLGARQARLRRPQTKKPEEKALGSAESSRGRKKIPQEQRSGGFCASAGTSGRVCFVCFFPSVVSSSVTP